MEDLLLKVEEGNCILTTNLSKETISSINVILRYEANDRLIAIKLIKHSFLNGNVRNFIPIYIQNASKKVN